MDPKLVEEHLSKVQVFIFFYQGIIRSILDVWIFVVFSPSCPPPHSTRKEECILFESAFQTDLVQRVISPHVCGLCVCVCARVQIHRRQRRKEDWRQSGSKVWAISLLKTYRSLHVTPNELLDHHMTYLSPLEATRCNPMPLSWSPNSEARSGLQQTAAFRREGRPTQCFARMGSIFSRVFLTLSQPSCGAVSLAFIRRPANDVAEML